MDRKAVAAIILQAGKILIAKKIECDSSILSGKWHIPGETLKEKEDDFRGLKRGMKEEAGIEILSARFLASHITPKGTTVNWYECIPLTIDIRPGSDVGEVKWVPKRDVVKFCDSESISLWPEKIREYFNF